MSWKPLTCSTCRCEGVFDRTGPFGGPGVHGVSWRCPGCQALSLDVCPVGPIEPTRETCLNCGAAGPGESACGSCGMTGAQVRAELGRLDRDPLEAAAEAFERGTFRRGLALLNAALVERPDLPAVWEQKARILGSLQRAS